MSKKNKDLKRWQENFLGFIVGVLLTILLFVKYNSIYTETAGTKGKVMKQFLRAIDKSFGKEYVFGFLIIVTLIFGIQAMRGYAKKNNRKKE
jgi:predicted negative regulator of RcsB-dependent stress response